MPDWLSSMQQTFEYYVVDPNTWKDAKRLDNVISCTINRDLEAETLGSASISMADSLGECYIRVYLITIQNGVREKHPLGTYLIQTPSSSFDGKIRNISMDAYTPLIELKEDKPDLGYYIAKKENVMDYVYRLAREHARAPVTKTECATKLFSNFVADTEDTWLSFLSDLASNAKYRFSLDELGRILLSPNQDTASLQPVWTYTDNNSSILHPNLTMDHDLYGIPNVVEVLYSDANEYYYAVAVNDDPNSPVSTVNRGRRLPHRVTNPSVIGDPTGNQVKEYAERLLKELSTVEYKVSYTHGYCPVRLGDCVRFEHNRAQLKGVKAKVISQSIKCEPGCPVTETAVFTTKLWG